MVNMDTWKEELVVLSIIMSTFMEVNTFNIEIDSGYTNYSSGSAGSYFGFSLAMFQSKSEK